MAEPRPQYLLQLTDCHLAPVPGQRYRDRDADAGLAAVVRDAQALGIRFDQLLLTGDLVHHGQADGYQRLLRLVEPLELATSWLPGNHDDLAAMQALAQARPDGAVLGCKRLDLGAWRILLLDSTSAPDGRGAGELAQAELDWLAGELAQAGPRHLLLALHHNALPTGSAWQDPIRLRNGPRLRQLLQGCPQVRAVICGHLHQHQRWQVDGVTWWSAPSTVFQFKPGQPDLVEEDDPQRRGPGYCYYRLDPDGQVEARVRWLPVS